MDLDKLIKGLEAGIKLAEVLVNTGKNLGLPKQVENGVKLASSLMEIARNIEDALEKGKILASTRDEQLIKTMIAEIRATNDKLAADIANS